MYNRASLLTQLVASSVTISKLASRRIIETVGTDLGSITKEVHLVSTLLLTTYKNARFLFPRITKICKRKPIEFPSRLSSIVCGENLVLILR